MAAKTRYHLTRFTRNVVRVEAFTVTRRQPFDVANMRCVYIYPDTPFRGMTCISRSLLCLSSTHQLSADSVASTLDQAPPAPDAVACNRNGCQNVLPAASSHKRCEPCRIKNRNQQANFRLLHKNEVRQLAPYLNFLSRAYALHLTRCSGCFHAFCSRRYVSPSSCVQLAVARAQETVPCEFSSKYGCTSTFLLWSSPYTICDKCMMHNVGFFNGRNYLENFRRKKVQVGV